MDCNSALESESFPVHCLVSAVYFLVSAVYLLATRGAVVELLGATGGAAGRKLDEAAAMG